MDITPLFKACTKTVKTRNRTFGIQSPTSDDKQRILKTKPKSTFAITAKDITSQISKLRDFLLEHREDYLSFFNNESGNHMSDAEREQIESGAQRVINTCSHLLREFRVDVKRLGVTPQTREYMEAVVDLIDSYLKSVCKIHSELKALRVKRALDIRKLAKLELPKTCAPLSVNKNLDIKLKEDDKDLTEVTKTNLNLSENEVAVNEDNELSAEELQMFESENVHLFNELNSMTEEVRQIESKVLHIAELQEIFTEKVLYYILLFNYWQLSLI